MGGPGRIMTRTVILISLEIRREGGGITHSLGHWHKAEPAYTGHVVAL